MRTPYLVTCHLWRIIKPIFWRQYHLLERFKDKWTLLAPVSRGETSSSTGGDQGCTQGNNCHIHTGDIPLPLRWSHLSLSSWYNHTLSIIQTLKDARVFIVSLRYIVWNVLGASGKRSWVTSSHLSWILNIKKYVAPSNHFTYLTCTLWCTAVILDWFF